MKVVAKAWADAAFKARLLAEPAAVLKENGIETPEGMAIKILEDSATVAHLILPEKAVELSEADLEQLAAGLIPGPLPRWSRVGALPIVVP